MSIQSTEFVKLYADESAALRRRVVRKLGNFDEAEDVVQDAYLRMLTMHGEYSSLRCPKAFLFTVASNLVVECVRRDQRQERLFGLIPNVEVVLDDDELNVVCPGCPVEDRVDAMMRLSQVIEALDELPAKCREAFVIHKFHQLSYAETADQMGVSVSLIEKLISRSLRHLRDRVQYDG